MAPHRHAQATVADLPAAASQLCVWSAMKERLMAQMVHGLMCSVIHRYAKQNGNSPLIRLPVASTRETQGDGCAHT